MCPLRETMRTSIPACPPCEAAHGRAARHACRAKRRAGETRCARCASGARERLDTPAARSGARKRSDVPAVRSGAQTSSSACPLREAAHGRAARHARRANRRGHKVRCILSCEPARITLHANKPPANPSGFAGGFLSVRGKTSPDLAQSRLSTGVRSRNSREMLHRAAMPMTA